MVKETFSQDETFELGRKIGQKAEPGLVISLNGDLGCGKTVLAQGIAAGLGIKEPVSSPTFTILQVYEGGRLPLFHFDVYRIEDESEMEETGYEDCFFGEGVSVVEWGDRVQDILPEDCLRADIRKDPEKGFDYRRIEISQKGNSAGNI